MRRRYREGATIAGQSIKPSACKLGRPFLIMPKWWAIIHHPFHSVSLYCSLLVSLEIPFEWAAFSLHWKLADLAKPLWL